MHGLGERSLRRSTKIVCLLIVAALASVGPAGAAQPGHGFNKGDWPFRPLERPAVPSVGDQSWAVNPIDQFIFAELNKRGLEPSKPAQKVALLRRVTFDLIGLPPTPAEPQ